MPIHLQRDADTEGSPVGDLRGGGEAKPNPNFKTADLIGQYIKLRTAVEVKHAQVEQDGMSPEDEKMHRYLVQLAHDTGYEFLHEIANRFSYLATGVGAYTKAMQALEGEVTRQINEMDGQSIKTEQGTAYRTTVLAVKVADRESFLAYVLESENYGFLTNHVSKEAVQDHIAKFNTPPPGVDVVQVYKTNFRKAS